MVFESSFDFTYVLFGAVVAFYYLNDMFGVTVDMMSDRSGFAHGTSHVIVQPSHCADSERTHSHDRCHRKSSHNLKKKTQVREIIRITCFQSRTA